MVNDINTTSIPSAVQIYPVATGAEGGVLYAEFLVESFSTIGFFSSSSPHPLQEPLINPAIKSIAIFPNPVISNLNIDYKNISGVKTIILQSDGKQVLESIETKIDMSGLAAGVYHVLFVKDGMLIGKEKVLKTE